MSSATIATDYGFPALKERLKSTWMAGDYDRFSRYMELGALEFFQRLPVPPGARLLDVACGSGQLALIAARHGAQVTGVDIASNLVRRATDRARAERIEGAHFREADAEDLPFPDADYDVVTSLVGAMFAPKPELVAREMLRVCRSGGLIAMANWTPQGFIGRMLRTVSAFIAPSGLPSPLLWGDESTVRERFADGASSMDFQVRPYAFDYPFAPFEVVELFRRYYGPVNRAFAALDEDGQARLFSELETLWSDHNLATDGFTRVEAQWLEVRAVRA